MCFRSWKCVCLSRVIFPILFKNNVVLKIYIFANISNIPTFIFNIQFGLSM